MLKKRKLGRSGLEVSELALGGLFISSYGTDRASADAVIRRAWELGVNYIDIAPGYMDSESVLGDTLSKLDAGFIISTKIGYKPEPFKPQDIDFLRKAVKTSLSNLKRENVDILMIHEPDRPETMDWWTDKGNYEGPVMDVLREARDQYKARFVGLGGTTAYEITHIAATGKFDVLLTAFQYSLLWREAEHSLLPTALNRDMGVVCGSPMQQGALAKMYERDVNFPARWLSPPRQKQFKRLYGFARDCGIDLPELSLRFVLSNPSVSTVLTGVRTIAELESNVAAVERGPLPENMLEELSAIADLVPFRPYQEPLGLPFGT
ncbi:MAG: aldo/keto reductase [Victivallales bacterium]|nr:aldo/keto reductase [Victivallales bacterium]